MATSTTARRTLSRISFPQSSRLRYASASSKAGRLAGESLSTTPAALHFVKKGLFGRFQGDYLRDAG